MLEYATNYFIAVLLMLQLSTYFVKTHCLYSHIMCICYNCSRAYSFYCGPFMLHLYTQFVKTHCLVLCFICHLFYSLFINHLILNLRGINIILYRLDFQKQPTNARIFFVTIISILSCTGKIHTSIKSPS